MHGDLKVFCVSNTDYLRHRNDERSIALKHLELSGITALRRYCQSIPAEAQFRAVAAFLEHQVPTLVGSIRQWVLQGSDGVTTERAEALRRVLERSDECFRQVCLGYASQSSVILIRAVDSYTIQTQAKSKERI